MPRLDGPHRVSLATDDDCLDELLALPPPIPARDESIGVALLTYGLVHQWTSSRAALVAALERRRRAAWRSSARSRRDVIRLAPSSPHGRGRAMRCNSRFRKSSPQRRARRTTDLGRAPPRRSSTPARGRGAARIVCARRRSRRRARRCTPRDSAAHPGERIIAFCHYAETVNALWARLGRDAGVAALTASARACRQRSRDRDAVLAQFDSDGDAGRDTTRASESICSSRPMC